MKKSSLKNIFSVLVLCSQIPTLQATIYEPATVWDKNTVTVCFLDEQHQLGQTRFGTTDEEFKKNGFAPTFNSSEEKEIIKTTINNTFTKATTGIHFNGWKNCSEEATADVLIMKAEKVKGFIFKKRPPFKGYASIGENGAVTSEGRFVKSYQTKPFVILYTFDPAIIVHEFGHLAGLRHEHVHPEAKKVDSSCYSALYSKEITTEYSVVTEYDRASIMNYCRINNKYNKSSALSSKDRETLLKIYGKK